MSKNKTIFSILEFQFIYLRNKMELNSTVWLKPPLKWKFSVLRCTSLLLLPSFKGLENVQVAELNMALNPSMWSVPNKRRPVRGNVW